MAAQVVDWCRCCVIAPAESQTWVVLSLSLLRMRQTMVADGSDGRAGCRWLQVQVRVRVRVRVRVAAHRDIITSFSLTSWRGRGEAQSLLLVSSSASAPGVCLNRQGWTSTNKWESRPLAGWSVRSTYRRVPAQSKSTRLSMGDDRRFRRGLDGKWAAAAAVPFVAVGCCVCVDRRLLARYLPHLPSLPVSGRWGRCASGDQWLRVERAGGLAGWRVGQRVTRWSVPIGA